MDSDVIRMEEYMDVVYSCKFCPVTCKLPTDMGAHVRENHLPLLLAAQGSPSIRNKEESNASNSPLTLTLDGSASMAAINSGNSRINANSSSSNSSNFNMQESEDVLGFSADGHTFMDKGLSAVSQGEQINLSNNSTPDLTELINLVKPSDSSSRNLVPSEGHFSTGGPSQYHASISNHMPVVSMSSGDHVSSSDINKASVIQLHSSSSQMSPMSQSYNTAELDALNVSQPYTVMAIHLPNLAMNGTNSVPQYIMNTPEADSVNIPDHTETKEFLLCGLCRLAFNTMEECQAHMQLEHKELMQGSGVSIGVQAGGAKRGRKRKSEQQLKIKTEFLDSEDLEWLPSVSDNSRTAHADGSMRRKVKPPRALKEDYVLGKRPRKRIRESCVNLGYKIVCPMMNCKAKFKTDLGLHIHMSCHNMDDTAFTCMKCQTHHEFWKHLRIHLWRQHKVDCDLFKCEQCDYKTDTHHKLSIHKEIHTNVKPYTCDACGKGFRQASQMKNHQVIHADRGEKSGARGWFSSKSCDVCDRVFANSKCLKKHKEAVHTSHKPFECMYCNHTTARKAMMELHIRTHTGEKPFKCDICTYSTGDHNSMRRHKMRHTGQKQYRCTQCPYTCIQSISLKQHMRHKHPGTSAGIFQCSRCPFRTINQGIYGNHMQDHKKGLIPDKLIPPRLELPKSKKLNHRSQSGKRQAAGQTLVEPLLIKHPQFHAVLPGSEPTSLTNISGDAIGGLNAANNEASQTEVFTMQVTMLPEGDTQISADDMTRLSESTGLLATGVSPLQLIYATLSTISEQGELARVGEGRSALLTAELIGGIHTAVLSSMQDGVTVHSISYHLPKVLTTNEMSGQIKLDGGLIKTIKVENTDEAFPKDESGSNPVVLPHSSNHVDLSHLVESADDKCDEIFFIGNSETRTDSVVVTDQSVTNEKLKKSQKNRVEKILGSSALREMLESREKLTVLNTENGEVNFLTVDFLEPQPISSTSQVFSSSEDS
ncbi:zinc finger protein 652-like isoform X2 [Physella acuta]|uniref:zinc finger protein 652-like isoform X2 n=1 Tax=Physella acuta TaxID=109671 RepID=UPI0027DCF5D9|nr:zinc finger protein 652-like isoform X2 [Physella acuta]